MPTNKQRREAARRKLERQLEARQARARRRRRANIIASVVGAVVVLAVVIAFVVVGNSKGSDTASGSGSGSATPTSPAASPTASATPSTSYPAASGAAVSFDGVTVKGATDLKGKPAVTSKSSTDPAKLQYKDLVVGTGQAATPASTVTVQYVGVLYKTGKAFDNSWDRGMPTQFPLTGVVKGFTQGIGGTTGVPAMKVGGRRIVILPSSLGYGSQANGDTIPANSSLVFVIDLVKTAAAAGSSGAATVPGASSSAASSPAG